MLPRLFLIAQIMTVWMLVDAVRRRAELTWFFIIFLPFGEWIYFFSIKIHDPSMHRLRNAFKRKPRPESLSDLQRNARRTPSSKNKLKHAEALLDRGDHAAAEQLFSEVVDKNPHHKGALFGAGVCRARLGDLGGAIAALNALMALDASFADYAAHLELCDLLWKTGGRSEAIEETEKLVKASPRARHRVTLAHYLIEDGKQNHARLVLQTAIEEHEVGNNYERKRDKQWIKQAHRMLANL